MKILHTADIHIREYGDERWESLQGLIELGKKVTLCELALENKGIDPKDVRDEHIIIEKLPPFLMDAEGATMTYVF